MRGNERKMTRRQFGLAMAGVIDRLRPENWRPSEEKENLRYQFLNGGCTLFNHHELLFLPDFGTIARDIGYAASLGAKVIRTFATDANLGRSWDGRTVANRIAAIAPMLRATGIKLIVPLVNNHQPVPGESEEAIAFFGGYTQLAEPFYRSLWQGAYRQFVAELVGTTLDYGVRDVIFAWEVGNELHTPYHPWLFLEFFDEAVSLIRSLDSKTMIAPGTMGINHLDPGNPASEAGLEFYRYLRRLGSFITLHAYDFVVDNDRPVFVGDMPVHWDLDLIDNYDLRLPLVVEELGFSKRLRPYWEENESSKRVWSELNTIRYLLQRGACGFGPWSGCLESKWGDSWRGISSYPGDSVFTHWQSRSERAQVELAYKNLPNFP